MGQSKVNIIFGNGNLANPDIPDGGSGLITTGVAVGGQFALGDILALTSLQDAIDLGIDAAYDTTNKSLAYHQIKAFYDEAGDGANLWVMIVVNTTSMTTMTDESGTIAKKLIDNFGDQIRLIGITRTPQTAYSPTYTDQFDDDMWAAVTNAQQLADQEIANNKFTRFLIEGRDFQGTVGSAKDLRTAGNTDANRVSIVMGQDRDVAALDADFANYADVGTVLGRLASVPVQRNPGRPIDGAIAATNVGMSDNSALTDFTQSNLDSLNDKGYIYFRKHHGYTGYFINDDHTAVAHADDYSQIHLSRIADKAADLSLIAYTRELNGEIAPDPATGKLARSVIKNFEGIIERDIEKNMIAKGELVAVQAFVDPAQDASTTVDVSLALVPHKHAKIINVTLNLANKIN